MGFPPLTPLSPVRRASALPGRNGVVFSSVLPLCVSRGGEGAPAEPQRLRAGPQNRHAPAGLQKRTFGPFCLGSGVLTVPISFKGTPPTHTHFCIHLCSHWNNSGFPPARPPCEAPPLWFLSIADVNRTSSTTVFQPFLSQSPLIRTERQTSQLKMWKRETSLDSGGSGPPGGLN